jgi:hypothetical protein
MEDIQKHWEHGVNVCDEYKKQHFNLKTIIFYTVNDNSARSALIGQVKGKTPCVVCVDQTESNYLPSSSKLVYKRTADSYHLNIGIINGDHSLMVRSRIERH